MTKSFKIGTRRVLIPGMYNVRDLGGILNQDGIPSQFGRFLRTDVPTGLTPQIQNNFQHIPLRLVIDLRTTEEIQAEPNSFADHKDIAYRHIPLLYHDEIDAFCQVIPEHVDNMLGRLYFYLIDQFPDRIALVFRTMAQYDYDDGAILFHCSMGKDRTGIIAALLQDLIQQSDEDIIADYQISAAYLAPKIERLKDLYPGNRIQLIRTDYWNMTYFLKQFRARYKNAETFLLQNGLNSTSISVLKDRLLKPSPKS